MRLVKSSFLYRYILSYVLVLAIPVIAFVIFANARFINALNEERIRNSENSLYTMMYNSDSIIDNLNNLKLQFFFDRRITPFTLAEEIPKAMESIQLLNTITQSNGFVFEAAIHFIGDEFIFTSQGSFTSRLFHGAGFGFTYWNEGQFLADLADLTRPSVRSSEEVLLNNITRVNLVTFMYPLNLRVGAVDAVVLFMVEDSLFLTPHRSGDHADYMPAASFVLNQQGEVIVSYVSNNLDRYYFYSLDFSALMQESRSNAHNILNIAGGSYLVSAVTSPQTGWQYLSFTPLDSVMALTARIRNELLAVILVIMSVAAVVIYLGIRSNYQPFAKLSKFAEVYHYHGKDLNEIETVRETIRYLDRKNTEIVKHSFTASEEYILRRLLSGFTFDKSEMQRLMSNFDISFPHPSFAVLSLVSDVTDTGAFVNAVKTSLRPPIDGYVLNEQTNGALVAVLNFDSQQVLDYYGEILNLHESICKTGNISVTIGAGNIYDGIENISKSYSEARFAGDFRFIRGNGTVIFMDEIIDTVIEPNLHLPGELDKFKRLVQSGDGAGAEVMLSNLFDVMLENNVSVFKARRLCYDILNVVTLTVISLELDDEVDADMLSNAAELIDKSTANEFIAVIAEFCHSISSAVKKDAPVKTSQIDQIKAYINANYTDISFSIQSVAENFDMGVTNLSQFFKKKTNQTLVDYVTDIRMEHAKELLKTKKHKLDDIAGLIGYMNTSSFIRRFKQYYGLTPGQYAKEQN